MHATSSVLADGVRLRVTFNKSVQKPKCQNVPEAVVFGNFASRESRPARDMPRERIHERIPHPALTHTDLSLARSLNKYFCFV